MAGESPFEKIMPIAKIKSLLALSKRDPVNVAICLTSDSDGLMLLDKKAKPRSLSSLLKTEAGKAKIALNVGTMRFGRAEVDPDYDPSMVRLFVNKEAPGNMRAKLVEVVRKGGFQKVEINIDASIDAEPETEGAPVTAAPEVLTPPPKVAEKPDPAALNKELAMLARRIPEVPETDPARAKLLKLANSINVLIKTNNTQTASDSLKQLREELREALDAAGVGVGQVVQNGADQPKPGGAPDAKAAKDGPVAYAKARMAWQATRKKLDADLQTLRGAIRDSFAEDGNVDTIDREFVARTKPVLETLDDSLADTLDDAINATDAAKRAELVSQSKQIIKRYQDFIASDILMRELDGNPFVPLSTTKVMTATLGTLATAVH